MLLVSYDSKYLFNSNGSRLDVYSVASGELVYRLCHTNNSNVNSISQRPQLADLNHIDKQQQQQIYNESIIQSICLNTTNKYQLLSFHSGGAICLWDYEDGLLLKSFESKLNIKKVFRTESTIYALGNLKQQTTSLGVNTNSNSSNTNNNSSNNSSGSLSATLSNGNTNDLNNKSFCLYKLIIDETFKTKSIIEHQLVLSNLNINEAKLAIELNSQASYVAYIEGRRHLVVNQFKKNVLLKKFNAKLELSCLAIHPNEDCIATGTTNGKIILWYNYLSNDSSSSSSSLLSPGVVDSRSPAITIGETASKLKQQHDNQSTKPTKNVLHWHSLCVLSLCFTPEGSYLLSGGHECVLVKWMFKSGQKDFKPRLGAPLNEILCSKDNTLYVTGHLDNSIHLIGSNLNVLQTYSGFICPSFSNRNIRNDDLTIYPVGLNYFSHLNCLITNGRPGHLQFYSFTADKLLFNLDIVDENYISPENLNRPNVHTEVEHIAFNYDSSWFATVERRDDQITTPEIKLKFWQYDSTNNKFSLNTLVRYPHSFDKVNKIKFKPKENILFTCGEDGCFKSWIVRENKLQATNNETNQAGFSWIYNSCNGYRDLIPNDIDILNLDSNLDLIAVTYNHITTLWLYDDQETLITFCDDLIHCDSNDPIKQIKFINNSHLFVAHKHFINVWSISILNNNNNNNLDELKLRFNCVWSEQISELLSINENPADSSQLILFIKNLYKNQQFNNEETTTQIKICTFDLKCSVNNTSSLNRTIDVQPDLKVVHTVNLYSTGRFNFICLKKSNFSPAQSNGNRTDSIDDVSLLFDKIDIFYCDNRGLLQKLVGFSRGENGDGDDVENTFNSLTDHINVDLNESMWNNRKLLNKNIPKSSLTSIIELHKSKNFSLNSSLIENERNNRFEANLSKIESTPAYLLPRVSSFCYEILKSMLHKIDDEKTIQNGISTMTHQIRQ